MEKLRYPAAKVNSYRGEKKPATEVIIEDKVFVAVGKDAKASKSTLKWAIRNSGGKKICILHVHQHAKIKFSLGNKVPKGTSPDMKEDHEKERIEMSRILDEYLHICAKKGVQVENLFYETKYLPIEKAIVDVVTTDRIGNLVMGAASDSKYSRKMREPQSSKAMYVRKNAPAYCNIWFVCKGNLIHTREGSKASSSSHGAERPEMKKPQQLPSDGPSTSKPRVDSERDVKGKGKVLEALLQAEDKSRDSSDPRDLGSGVNRKLNEELEKAKAEAEKSKAAAEKSKRQAYEDSMKRQIAERESRKAVEKAKEELEKRRKAEETLTITRKELEDLKENRDSVLEDLAKAKKELAEAKNELAEAKKDNEDRKNENVVTLGEFRTDLDEKSSVVVRIDKIEQNLQGK